MNIRIDPEFKDYLGALSEEARQALEASLRAEGCRDALVVWPQPEGGAILLDGHNRYEICERLGRTYRTVNCSDSVTDRTSALAWIVQNQQGRRNVTQRRTAYLRGKVYRAEKKTVGGSGVNQHSEECSQSGYIPPTERTCTRVARLFKVSKSTILRNAAFSETVDAIAEEHGLDAREDILEGRKQISDFIPQPQTTGKEEHQSATVSKPSALADDEQQKDSDHAPHLEPSAKEEDAPPEPETAVDVRPFDREPTPEEQRLARIRSLTDGECTIEMARNAVILPGHDCGATAKPIPLPENASPNFANPEVARREGGSFGFAVTEMERHALEARTALTLCPPPSDMRSILIQRLAALETAIRNLSGSLKEKE